MATHPPSPAPDPAEFLLTPQGEYAGRPPIRINKPVVLLGSDEHCHLRLVSSSVSRHHAMIVRQEDRLYICDLGSRTKVRVNGHERHEADLADGDEVRIGKFSFIFTASRPPAGAAAHPEPVRLIVDGQAAPTPAENRLVLIGRTAGSDVVLVEESVSSRHAVIFEVGDKRYVRDLNSRTGTLLNGQKIHQHQINLGDELRIGATTLKLAELAEPAEPAAEPAAAPPAAGDETVPLEPAPIPVVDDVESPPAAAADVPISLALAPTEPTEQRPEPPGLEPAPLFAVHPFDEPLPLELEPPPPSHPVAESSPEPAPPAADHPDDSPQLEPATQAMEPTEAAAPPAPVADHPFDEPLPLELEPEPPSHPVAESSPEPASPPADHRDEPLEFEPERHAKEADAAAAPPAPILEHPFDKPLPLELEPEPPSHPVTESSAEPAPLVADHRDEPLELDPERHAKEADAAAARPAPEIEPSVESAPLELEAEPTFVTPAAEQIVPPALPSGDANEETHLDLQPPPEEEPAEQAIPVAQAAGSSAVVEPEPKTEAVQAVHLSDATAPLSKTEPAQPTAAYADSTLDLLAELAAKPPEEFKPVEFAPEPLPEAEPAEPTAASSAATIDLADTPSIPELMPEPVPEPEPIEQTAVSSAPTIDLSDAPSIPELMPEPVPEPEPIEQTAVSSAATIDLSDAPSIPELMPEPVPEPEPIEQTAVSSAATIDLSDAPAILELEPEPAPPLVEQSEVADSDSKTVDLDADSTPPEIAAEHAPINFDLAPIVEETPPMPPPEVSQSIAAVDVSQEAASLVEDSAKNAAEAAGDVPAEAALQRAARGRKRQSPAEPKPPKSRRSRAKRVPPKPADEESSGSVEATAPAESRPLDIEPPVVEPPSVESPVVEPPIVEPLAAEPPVVESPVVEPPAVSPVEPPAVSLVEPPAIEIPDLAVAHAADEPPDSSVSIPEPISADRTLTASEDVVAPEPAAAAPAEPPPVEPPRLPKKPFVVVGSFAHLSGGTVNLDHSLGGLPIKLPELAPVPAGFGHVKVSYAGKASSPFSAFAKSAPLVFDDAEVIAPPSPQPPELAQPESIVTHPAPPPPAHVEAQLETVVTPSPPPPSSPAQPPQPQPAPKPAPPIPRAARPLASGRRAVPMNEPRPQRVEPEPALGQTTTAFDGLAPAFREADAFSNFDAVPLNDAAFGGARLSRSDEYHVPESPETAARLADGPEHDFAEDDFWNRTDEEDGLTPMDVPPAPPAPPVSPAADHEDPAALVIPETAAVPQAPAAPIPAEALEADAQTSDSGEESGPADNSTMESSEPASSQPPLPSETPVAPPRKRRRFRIPFLMPVLLLAIGLSLGAIWRFTAVQWQIVGRITFENCNWTPGTRDGTEFEASQRRLLDSDQTRRGAVEFLRRDHPNVSPGFLDVPDLMGRVVSSVSLSSIREAAPAETVLQLSYSGANKDEDRLRIMALLQSLVESNAPLLDANRRLRDAELQAQQTVDETQQKLDQIKTQLAGLQTVIDAQPPAEQMAALTAGKAQLEKARSDAEEAVNRDRDELARLEAGPPEAITAASTTPPGPSDAALKQMRRQLADLAAELDSAHADQVAGAVLARQQLETASKQFGDQLSTADEVLGSRLAAPAVRQFRQEFAVQGARVDQPIDRRWRRFGKPA